MRWQKKRTDHNIKTARDICFLSLVADGHDGRVGKEVIGSSTAVSTAHRLGAGRDIGCLNVNHFWPLLHGGNIRRDVELVGKDKMDMNGRFRSYYPMKSV